MNLIVVIIGEEGELAVDQSTVVKRKVLLDLEISLFVKKNLMVQATVTGRSKGNHFYNLSVLRLVRYD